MKIYNRLYTKEIVIDIYKRAVSEWKLYLQWKNKDSVNSATEHYHKCESLISLVESITVFDIGFGYNLEYPGNLKSRLDNFSFLLK